MRSISNPARLVPLTFLVAISLGTALLMIPAATAAGETTHLIDAIFTATSAICVTGLTTVDTATHWSPLGHVIMLAMVQAGGFGIMTFATLLAIVAGRRVSLATTLSTQSETHSSLAEVRKLPLRIAVAMAISESVIAVILTLRFHFGYGLEWGKAAWHGVFHAVSAFNNAGFALYSDSLGSFAQDWWVIFPICCAVVAGGLGFPVYFELSKNRKLFRPRQWSVHARLTVGGTIILLAFGFTVFLLVEWRNQASIGALPFDVKILNGIAASVFPRTAGFQTFDYQHIRPETMFMYYGLMLIGGGSAGAAGGMKVGTFFLLAYVIWSEVTGAPESEIGNRRIGNDVMRQALTVALLAIGLVSVGTFVILSFTHFSLEVVLFETIAAVGTAGMSINLTPQMPAPAKIVLMVLMFCGRIGPATVVAAMAGNSRKHRYRFPEERPIVG